MINRRQCGKFRVGINVLERLAQDDINLLFKDMVILRAEALDHMRMIEYIAYNPNFSQNPEGRELPLYDVIFNDKEKLIEFREVDFK